MAKSYDQYCPVAEALDVVGERWTLLIVRELLHGPQRFTDLRVALPGIPPNLLTSRLRELEEGGLIGRRELPAPAARTVYELTEEGRGLEPTIRALARLGHASTASARRWQPQPGRRGAGGADGLRRPRAARAPERTWAAQVGDDVFTLRLADGRVSCWRGEPARPDLVVSADPADLIRLRRGDEAPLGPPAIRYQPADEELVGEFEAVFNLTPSR